MTTDSVAENGVKRGPRQGEADIVIHTAEGAIVGKIKSVKGRVATERVIEQLLKGGPVGAKTSRRWVLRSKPVDGR